MKHQMMYLDALESAKVELSLISKCNEKEEEKEEEKTISAATEASWARERWDDGTGRI